PLLLGLDAHRRRLRLGCSLLRRSSNARRRIGCRRRREFPLLTWVACTLTEHQFAPQRASLSFSRNGARGDFFSTFASLRRASAMAMSRKSCAALALALSSSSICPLLAACPKLSQSKSITASALTPSAFS